MTPQPRQPLPVLEVHDRTSLRAWLEANHDTSPGVRLAIGKKGGSATALTYTDAIEEALCFGWIDSSAGRLDDDRFTVLFTRRRPGSGWSRSNKDRVARLISNGSMTEAGLAVVDAAKADGSWNALDDVEDLVVPPDLAEALACDETARVGFEAASESARKMALHWIAGAKRQGTRANRIGEIVSRAAQGLPFA